jgi:aminopeptidase N
MGLLGASGKETHSELLIQRETQTWTFKSDERPVLSLNRNFSAPIKLKWSVYHMQIFYI